MPGVRGAASPSGKRINDPEYKMSNTLNHLSIDRAEIKGSGVPKKVYKFYYGDAGFNCKSIDQYSIYIFVTCRYKCVLVFSPTEQER